MLLIVFQTDVTALCCAAHVPELFKVNAQTTRRLQSSNLLHTLGQSRVKQTFLSHCEADPAYLTESAPTTFRDHLEGAIQHDVKHFAQVNFL